MEDKQVMNILEEWLYLIAPEPLKETIAELIEKKNYATARAMIDAWE